MIATPRTIGALLAAVLLATSAYAAERRHFDPPRPPDTGGPSVPAPRFLTDPEPDRVKNILYSPLPPEYVADSVAFFARNGVNGFIMSNFMGNWSGDIWAQPSRYTPDEPAGRVVGATNPLFRMAKRMNDRCRAAGIRYNSLNAYFSGQLPDWFDDVGWTRLVENFRQAAVFARDAGFVGVSIDMEYVHEQYQWKYPAYQVMTYPRHLLADKARLRGRQMVAAMLGEFPLMELWILPEVPSTNEWLANDMFVGYLDALSENDSPGGLHVFKEGTYLLSRPRTILHSVNVSNQRITYVLGRGGDRVRDYWARRCTVAPGLWPLGYYWEMKDEAGNTVAYGGKYERFGDADVGSQADKSDNYSAADFRRAYGAARMMAAKYVWQYCHGQVYTRMTPEQMARYRGTPNDTLPTIANVDEYLAVLRDRQVLDDPIFREEALAIREGRPIPRRTGNPPSWWVLGPIPYAPDWFMSVPIPGRNVDVRQPWRLVDGQYPLRWREVPSDTVSGGVNLKNVLGKTGTPVAFGVAWVESDRARRVWIGVGTNDNGAVWVNGTRVYAYMGGRACMTDDDRIAVDLPRGRSEIVIGCGDAGGVDWGFTLRIADEQGRPVPGVRWVGPPSR